MIMANNVMSIDENEDKLVKQELMFNCLHILCIFVIPSV